MRRPTLGGTAQMGFNALLNRPRGGPPAPVGGPPPPGQGGQTMPTAPWTQTPQGMAGGGTMAGPSSAFGFDYIQGAPLPKRRSG